MLTVCAGCAPESRARASSASDMPSDASSREDKGRFALFAMLLFRPWRGHDETDFLSEALTHGAHPLTEAETWEVLYQMFED